MSLPEKFCIAPFKNLVVNTSGNLMPCCDYLDNGTTGVENIVEWWNTGLNEIRNNMLTGIVDKNCRHCLSKEKSTENTGYTSLRQAFNSQYQKEIDTIVSNYKNGIVPSVESVELRVSNYCNLKCIMCGEYASSAIHNEYHQNKEKYNSVNVFMGKIKTVKWWENKETNISAASLFKDVKTLRLAGGEPLLVKKLFEVAKEIQTINHCKIDVTTSLYTENQHIIDLLLSMNLQITLSVEGIEEHNDYVRYGSKWDVIEKNLKKFDKITCSHVLQHTSIFSLPRLVTYCDTNNLKLRLGEVFSGSYPGENVLTINSAHPTDVNKFKQWLKNYSGPNKKFLDTWVGGYKYDSDLNQKFHTYMSMLDSIRGTNFKDTFNPTYDIKL
jgi:sulfatase maturation enzyme AslB (radical SAM superfamily)